MAKDRLFYIVAGAVTACVVVAIVVPLAVLLPDDSSTKIEPDYTFQFDDLYNSNFSYKSIYPNWVKNNADKTKFVASSKDGDNYIVVTRDISEPYTDLETLVPGSVYEGMKWQGYSVSADLKFAFFYYNRNKVWRHSYTANYYIYDIENKKTLVIDSLFAEDGANVHHMEWAPTGHKLAFVHEWTLKTIDLDSVNNPITSVSPVGEQNMKYYGIPDWVYEEEMIGAKNVLYWSPGGTNLAYLETSEDGVSRIEYSTYGDQQYPTTVEIAYPKAGTTNPTVKMWVDDLKGSGGSNSKELVPDITATDFDEYYFSRFTWLDNITCLVTWINRNQTHSVANLCTSASNNWTCVATEANEEVVDGGWVGSFGPFNPVWKQTSKDYFTVYAYEYDATEKDGRWQIVLVEENKPTYINLTKTDYDVTGLIDYDVTNDYLYFEQAAPLPRNRHIYRLKTDGSMDKNDPECMTCKYNEGGYYQDRCGWVSISFNFDRSMVVINCRGNKIPLTLLVEISGDGIWSEPTVLENNDELTTKVGQTKWPTKEYGTFQSTKYPGKGYNYEIWKPYDFDSNKKYPLLIEVYAGPEFQKITDTWTKRWAQTYMVANKGAIVVSVDGRGSAFEGYKFMRQIYLKLGQCEAEDQTDFAKFMASKAYIDETRVGIWGWSYGGYTTSHVLGYDGGETIKCGIAVAPLADWRYYDAMYAERYMGWPDSNVDGYDKASIVKGHDLNRFKNTWYVLIHGTADDNVHFQNAAEMEKALVEHDVDFDDFFYADQAHSINIGNASPHIYRQLTTRMSYCLGLDGGAMYPGAPAN